MKLSSFRYTVPQAFKSMFNNGWMTVAAVLTITISLFLCTMFWLLLINIDANASDVEEDIRVMVYLDSTVVMDEQFDQIEQQLKWIGGVSEVEFVPKEEGIKSLEGRFGDMDIIDTLGGNNPLPDMYSITALSTDYVTSIAADAEVIEGVSMVRYGEGTVDNLLTLTDTLRKAGIIIMALLAVAAVVLIAMAIRLTIMSRRKEIMIMKWTGATNGFIRWPFILEGLFLGILGSAFALALVLLLYSGAADYINTTAAFIQTLPLSQIWLSTSAFTLGAGVILGAIGSLIPMTRFLDV